MRKLLLHMRKLLQGALCPSEGKFSSSSLWLSRSWCFPLTPPVFLSFFLTILVLFSQIVHLHDWFHKYFTSVFLVVMLALHSIFNELGLSESIWGYLPAKARYSSELISSLSKLTCLFRICEWLVYTLFPISFFCSFLFLASAFAFFCFFMVWLCLECLKYLCSDSFLSREYRDRLYFQFRRSW